MRAITRRSYELTVTLGELIALLKDRHPDNMITQALPALGKDVKLTTTGSTVCLQFQKEKAE